MSGHMVEYENFESRLKGYGIEITASGRDDEESTVYIPGSDLREFYQLNPASFIDQYGEDAAKLQELFTAVKGIGVSEMS